MPASEYAPQLTTLVKTPPRGDMWLHEIKYDGYRIGCRIHDKQVALYSRSGKDWTASFPTIVEAARRLGVRDALIDGELCVVLSNGHTSFQALQHWFGDPSNSEGTLVYFAFDLLRHSRAHLDNLPLEERKARLKTLLGRPRATSVFRFADHVVGHGDAFLNHARRLGLEGIVSKRRDLPYRPGRHGGWLKIKCILRQEFVVGGFTDPAGARVGIGALLIGYYDAKGDLIFAGRVGTGFTQKRATELRARLDRLERRTPPFTPPPAGALRRTAHWVTPSLVAEVAFTEWTGDGKIRHPSFQGLRADKKPREVTREGFPP